LRRFAKRKWRADQLAGILADSSFLCRCIQIELDVDADLFLLGSSDDYFGTLCKGRLPSVSMVAF
jgi:hypothetical protein